METRVVLNTYLQECENTHFSAQVIDDKTDDSPYLLEIKLDEHEAFTQWVRESDINIMIRMLNKIKRERRRITGAR